MQHVRRTRTIIIGALVFVCIVALVGCGAVVGQVAPEQRALSSDRLAAQLPAPTMAAAPTFPLEKAMERGQPAAGVEKADGSLTDKPISLPLARYDRKIIKNAELTLQVQDTAAALDQVTAVATDYQGYIISSRVWSEGTYRLASVTLGVPADQFEQVLRRLRGLAVKVLNEQASGEDVTDQYVDLESRLRNLEATQSRIRAFLDQAVTVEEALEVNRQLSEIEGQIEEVKGKMNYLKERAAYSTITVYLEPERPTPTPTPTPTLPAWRPVETFNEASNTLSVILRFLGDLIIWLAVIFLPFIIPLAVIIWLIVRWSKGRAGKG
jgi:uncharacterized coiled-coil protein SlyX